MMTVLALMLFNACASRTSGVYEENAVTPESPHRVSVDQGENLNQAENQIEVERVQAEEPESLEIGEEITDFDEETDEPWWQQDEPLDLEPKGSGDTANAPSRNGEAHTPESKVTTVPERSITEAPVISVTEAPVISVTETPVTTVTDVLGNAVESILEITADDIPASTTINIPASMPVILTITGDGVREETTWSLEQLQALEGGYRELTFSTTNNWPSFGHMEAHGVSVHYLLQQAGMLNSAASFRFLAEDGYHATLTYNQLFGNLFSYASHSAEGSSGASVIEPLISWAWGDVGRVRTENIRSFLGQNGPWTVNMASFVRDLYRIEVSTASAGAWAPPTASIPDGSVVSAGTELELLHDHRDNIRIYYTLDGTEPNFYSPVFNPSASSFQPHLIVPLELTENVIIKAFAAGFGREQSTVATFNYLVE